MIRKSNDSERRILTFPAVHPYEGISLPTLITSLFSLSHRICSFKSKVFSCNKKNARKTIRMIEVLQIFLEEIRDHQWSFQNSLILSLSELHLTFQKLQFLLEYCTHEGSRLYMLMESGRVATHFQSLSRSVITALDVFPFSSMEISAEVKEQVELILKQARKGDLEVEPEDKRAMTGVLSVLDQFENSITPSESDLRLILDHIGVRRWSECNKEIKFLDAEIGYERMKEEKRKLAFLSSLMGFMSYCRCVVIEVVDDGEDEPKSDYGKESDIQNWCFNPDDFRCPISLEIMNDPVTIETGHTYDRSSILKWFSSSGSLTCPKTGRNLSSIELVPNLALRRLIHQYCSKNSILVSDLGRRNRGDRDNKTTCQPGSLAAQEAMKMLASFLGGKLQSKEEVERNRAAYEIRVLSKRNIFNRSCLVESGAIPNLLRLVCSSWRNPTMQENAMAALMNLSKHPKSRSIMVMNGGLELIVSVCKKGMKLESRHHAAATLFYLASDEENRRLIGEEPEAIPSLINLLNDGTDRGKKNGLVAIYGLLFHSENHKKVIEAEAIPLLVSIIKTCEREELVTDSLSVLAILAEKSVGATVAILQNGALNQIIEILKSSTSRVGKEQCVCLLLSVAINGGANVVSLLVNSPSLMGSLYSLLSEGTLRAGKKASALIRVLHDFCERRPSEFKASSVLPREQFIHVW